MRFSANSAIADFMVAPGSMVVTSRPLAASMIPTVIVASLRPSLAWHLYVLFPGPQIRYISISLISILGSVPSCPLAICTHLLCDMHRPWGDSRTISARRSASASSCRLRCCNCSIRPRRWSMVSSRLVQGQFEAANGIVPVFDLALQAHDGGFQLVDFAGRGGWL